MGVYIKGMGMPKSCEDCPMCHSNAEYDYAYCCVSSAETSGNKIPSDCPLVPIPPHGRLIDADAFFDDLLFPSKQFEQGMRALIGDAPTVIPAEETLKEATNDQNNS